MRRKEGERLSRNQPPKAEESKLIQQNAKSDQKQTNQPVSVEPKTKKKYLDLDQHDPLLVFTNIKSDDPLLSFVKSDY